MRRKLEDYPKKAIYAVLEMREKTAQDLSEDFNLHKSTVAKVINGTAEFASDALKQKIFDYLQPDLEKHYRLHLEINEPGEPNMLVGEMISPEAKTRLATVNQ